MRVVFMGTPDIAVLSLEALVKDGYEIVGVYTQPDRPAGRGQAIIQSPVKQAASRHGLPVLQPASLRDPEEIEKLRRLAPDLIIVAAFGQLLPKAILDMPSYKVLNVHPSLLPKYRGPSPIAYTILNGDGETGVTIMVLTPKMDAGPILAQKRVAISPEDTTGTLQAKLAKVGAELLRDTIPAWIRGEITPRPQDEDKITFSKMIAKEDGILDWSQPADALSHRVRAFQPWPGTQTRWKGKVLKIIEAGPVGQGQGQRPGTALRLNPEETGFSLGIQTGDGILGLGKVQLEGRKAVNGDEFLRGQREIIGDILPS